MNWNLRVSAVAVAISRPPLPVSREIVIIAICYSQQLMHYLGLDIGGTSIKAGLVDETAPILESRTTHTVTDNLDAFLFNVTELIREFQNTTAIETIGMGVPGLVNAKTHIIETAPNIPCLQHLNLEQRVADQVQLRCVSENDANAAAYAEFVCGSGIGIQQMAHLTVGTGLGSGLILNGNLFAGASGYGGEFGHTVLGEKPHGKNEGRLCGCGNRGCVETFVSATGIVTTAREHGMPGSLTSKPIYEAAIHGDATAMNVY